jgi:competence ComEA-like helix-hairpin-helix protein
MISGCKRGSVLVGLLWCVALLAVFVMSVLYTSRLDLQVAKNSGDSVQAYYLALAGAEKAKAVIFHDAAERKRSARNHSSTIYNDPNDFRDVTLGRGEFRVIHQGTAEEGGKLLYGVTDEESRLSINEASMQQLTNLYQLTAEIAAAIVDWRDQDSNPSPAGAEAEYYASQRPPYTPRNDRIQTARELLLVRGVTRALLLGEDANQNGILDPEEDDGDANYPPDNRDGLLDPGWSGALCFESRTQNKNAAGQARVNVQTADENALTGVQGITPEIAKAIVQYRGQNKLESLVDLLEVSAMSQPSPTTQPQAGAQPQPASPGQPEPQPGSPNPQQNQVRAQPIGPKLISEDLLFQIADDVTTASESAHRGLVNINTASSVVLRCLPGVTEELARAIIDYRSSAGFFPNAVHLLKVPGMTRQSFKQISALITVRSETFRIVSEGKVRSSGARRRIELIVQLGNSGIDTLSYRENL